MAGLKPKKEELTIEKLLKVITEHQKSQENFSEKLGLEILNILSKQAEISAKLSKTNPEMTQTMDTLMEMTKNLTTKVTTLAKISQSLDGIQEELKLISRDGVQQELRALTDTLRLRMEEDWDFDIFFERNERGQTERARVKTLK